MTDRELLELAAKAAGIILRWPNPDSGLYPRRTDDDSWNTWAPLTDDGDALRLAVKLGLSIDQMACEVIVSTRRNGAVCALEANDDPLAATRRAIVSAAAEIGKGML